MSVDILSGKMITLTKKLKS